MRYGEMKRYVFATLATLFLLSPSPTYAEPPQHAEQIERFIEAVKTDDPRLISEFIGYPLIRIYPVPPVDDISEFVARYSQLFDAALKKRIVESDIESDWTRVGWRGTMLGNGLLWFQDDGKVNAINYQTDAEKVLRRRIIAEDRNSLHENLRDFEEPILEWETARFRIRIDAVDEGYRYASWPVDAPAGSKPSLVINGGEMNYDGSGGNHFYRFVNGEYEYICSVVVLGTKESPPGFLRVKHDGNVILSEPVLSFRQLDGAKVLTSEPSKDRQQ